MELRDYIGIITAVVGIASLVTTWLRQRGLERDRFMRDELAAFTRNQTIIDQVKPDVLKAVKDAELVLSLELAERARRVAVRKAATAAAMGRRITRAAILTVIGVAVLQYAAYSGPTGDVITFWGGVVYFTTATGIVIAAFIIYVLGQRRVSASTANLRELRKRVTAHKPIGHLDLRPQR